MQLPNFNLDPGFAELRRGMRITEIIKLKAPDWRDWEGFGIDVADVTEIEVQPDLTLSYMGRRVLVYIRDQYVKADETLMGYRYHVSECKKLTQMRNANRFGRYVVTTRTDGELVVNLLRRGENEPIEEGFLRPMSVCKLCLEALDWEGYSGASGATRSRIWRGFDPREFLERYGSRVGELPVHSDETAPLNAYPPDWAQTARMIKEAAQWTCLECGVDLNEPVRRKWLEVHHLDGNKSNCRQSNLTAICIGCHAEKPDHTGMKATPRYRQFVRWRSLHGED